MPSRRCSGLCHQGRSEVVSPSQVPSEKVLGYTIKAGAIKAKSGSMHNRQNHHKSLWIWIVGTLLAGQV